MRKTKHNKKRNTGFLYEALIRELTKAVVGGDAERKATIVFMIKEHFANNTHLAKELELYKALQELGEVGPIVAEKVLFEAKEQHKALDKGRLFNEQSHLINKINKILSKDVFSNFVPNYKNLATIAQIFSDEMPLKKRIILEQTVINDVESLKEKTEMMPIDDLVYKTFVKKFNDKYEGDLLQEQKQLLAKYISSFSDNGLDLKIYLNEEIGRLKQIIEESISGREMKKDPEMLESTRKVLNIVGDFKERQIDSTMLEKILKIQNLVSEIQADG